MPWLVDEPPGIAARVGKTEPELPGVLLEPGKGQGRFEVLLEDGVRPLGQIERAARVMLAVARGGDNTKGFLESLSALEPAADQGGLVVEVTETRNHHEVDLCGLRGGVKLPPSRGRLGEEPDRPAGDVLAACFEAGGERHAWKAAGGDPLGGDPERGVEPANAFRFLRGQRGFGGWRRIGGTGGHGRSGEGARV